MFDRELVPRSEWPKKDRFINKFKWLRVVPGTHSVLRGPHLRDYAQAQPR